jgi:hypothetical protein
MIDPVAIMLWHLLARMSYITPDELYTWDSEWAIRTFKAAGMREFNGMWRPGPDTAAWYQEMWVSIRHLRPVDRVAAPRLEAN